MENGETTYPGVEEPDGSSIAALPLPRPAPFYSCLPTVHGGGFYQTVFSRDAENDYPMVECAHEEAATHDRPNRGAVVGRSP